MLTVLVAALAVAVALGCGSDDDQGAPDEREAPAVSGEQRAILSTIDALHTACRQGDTRTICNEIFTERLAESIPDPPTAAARRRFARRSPRRTRGSPLGGRWTQRMLAEATRDLRSQLASVSTCSAVTIARDAEQASCVGPADVRRSRKVVIT